jgi:DNA-binding XRE family transcriptional regulator
MFDRTRLDPFSPRDFLKGPLEVAEFEEARRIQEAGVLLTQMRERAGLSVDELADRLHLEPQYIIRVEGGRLLESPGMSLMLQIAEVCGEQIEIGLRQKVAG